MVLRILFLFFLICYAHPLDAAINCASRRPHRYINECVDLRGETMILDENGELCFGPSGKLVNGIVEGHNTSLSGVNKNCFAVVLKGTWKTKTIKDEWFDDAILTDNQIIQNINVIQSDNLLQELWIEKNYLLLLDSKWNTGLSLSSNTVLHFDASISIGGNDLKQYSIVNINRKENVSIIGGEIIGDVGKHNYVEGSTSEWGHGVYIYKSRSIAVSGLKVSKCIGDAFYISGPSESDINIYDSASKQVVLKKCIMDSNRRQGISLIHAEDVIIEDCLALNMGQIEYTAPSFGLDIEPNKNNSVRNVRITHFVTENTKADCSVSSGGYQTNGIVSNRYNILFEKCKFDKSMAIMSGGVVVVDSDIPGLVVYPREMPDNPVVFKNCRIEGRGLFFSSRTAGSFTEGREPSYTFKYCDISPVSVYSYYPALIWGTDVKSLSKINLLFNNCSINLPAGHKKNDLIVGGFDVNCLFKKCTIDASDYSLTTNGLAFDKCRIFCKYIKVHSLPQQINVLRKCHITTTDSKDVIKTGIIGNRLDIVGCVFKNEDGRRFEIPDSVSISGSTINSNRFIKSEKDR